MALQDILTAITEASDHKIADARTVHQQSLTKLREVSERTLATRKQEIAMQKEKRKTQLQAKTQSHVAMQKQNAILKTQQKLLDKAYAGAVEKLSTLPDEKVEPIFRACLKDIKVKGAIYPAAKHASLLKKLAPSEQFSIEAPIEVKGGFRFVSEKIEEDCTFEYLVENVLRPRTELATAQSLFA